MEENRYATNRDYGGDRFSQDEAKLLGQPDVLCVDEYLHVYRARPAETPERRLLSAILSDAIDCYIRDCCAPNRHKKSSFREAEEWFFSVDDCGVFSFEYVCDALRIEAGYIRRGLVAYKQQHAINPASRVPEQHSDMRLAS
jgi:hypothetical protein